MRRARLLLLGEQGSINQEFEIKHNNLIIGRTQQANIAIQHMDISRLHAQIIFTAEGFFLCDLGSTNGTYLNGSLLESKELTPLQSNDQIKLGNTVMLFQVVPLSIPAVQSIRIPEEEQEYSENYSYAHAESDTISDDRLHMLRSLSRKLQEKLHEAEHSAAETPRAKSATLCLPPPACEYSYSDFRVDPYAFDEEQGKHQQSGDPFEKLRYEDAGDAVFLSSLKEKLTSSFGKSKKASTKRKFAMPTANAAAINLNLTELLAQPAATMGLSLCAMLLLGLLFFRYSAIFA